MAGDTPHHRTLGTNRSVLLRMVGRKAFVHEEIRDRKLNMQEKACGRPSTSVVGDDNDSLTFRIFYTRGTYNMTAREMLRLASNIVPTVFRTTDAPGRDIVITQKLNLTSAVPSTTTRITPNDLRTTATSGMVFPLSSLTLQGALAT